MERCRHINKPRVQLQGVRVKLKNAVDGEPIYWAGTEAQRTVLWTRRGRRGWDELKQWHGPTYTAMCKTDG